MKITNRQKNFSALKKWLGNTFVCFFLTSVLFVFLGCNQIQKKQWNEEKIEAEGYESFIESTKEYLQEKRFQGTVLIAKGSRIIFASGFGTEDSADKNSAPITINTTFEAGSISKQMTAAAIMQLVQKKKLSVDDKISRFFPDYIHGDEITVRMLLTMRSGLTDHINCPEEFFDYKLQRFIERKEFACEPLDRDIVLNSFYTAPLMTKPDTTYYYCNTDYYLLARIIEIVSKMPYEEYIQKNIFDRCGMTYSNTEFQKTTAKGYDYKKRYFSIPASLAMGCGDVNSNVTDLLKWNLQFTSGKVVSKKSFKEMTNSESYGYGVYCSEDSIFHGGTTDVFNSYDAFYFKDKVSIIVLINKPIYTLNATVVAGNIRKIMKENGL